MDRFWAIVQWVILLAVIIGVLRYWQGANALAGTFLGWVFGESQVLSGANPATGAVANYPNYNNKGA